LDLVVPGDVFFGGKRMKAKMEEGVSLRGRLFGWREM